MDPWVPRPCTPGWLRGGTGLVAGTWWHLKVSGKGKERETWQLPWLPAEHPPALARSTCEARPLLPGWFVGGRKGRGGSEQVPLTTADGGGENEARPCPAVPNISASGSLGALC